jgi:phosphohistidine phosphatase
MTLRLILTRHAKSDWDNPLLSDHERTLNARGRLAAPRIGAWLTAHGHLADCVLVSDAARTRETWALIDRQVPQAMNVRFMSALYLAAPLTIMRILGKVDAESVMVVAHNPGIAELAFELATNEPAHIGFQKYPTGATLVLEFSATHWSEIRPDGGRVVDFVVPSDLE